MSIKEKVLMKEEGVMNLFNVHKQRDSEMERRVMMISSKGFIVDCTYFVGKS